MSQDRLQIVMAMPEAAGRRELAKHLATATAMPLDQVRKALAAGHRDPVAYAGELVEQFRASKGVLDGKRSPKAVAVTPAGSSPIDHADARAQQILAHGAPGLTIEDAEITATLAARPRKRSRH
ncbi:hypothetical protein [Methylobacterium sp.]|uniref:hypothetical protein n=1 Tax=Methylobacterium sp. TaxID=409 RepID=UPI003B00DA4B